MDGILVIDKPAGVTSHDVVARVRKILNTRRVGHTGTLDPFATGVLVLPVGSATRLAQFLDKDVKEYVATVKLGFETETGDVTGKPRAESKEFMVTSEEIAVALERFLGESLQTPPMYSAKKIAGQKLYELARKGVEVERRAVPINIYEIGLIERRGDDSFTMRVSCSAGTYIRVLAEDIGKALGTGAHLTELRRTAAGQFSLQDSLTFDDLGQGGDLSLRLIPAEKAIAHLSEFKLNADRIEKTKNGLSTRVYEAILKNGEVVRMTDASGNVIAVGIFNEEQMSVRPKIVLV
jgi:tRNA pseudouridine55 synthase